jgi:hypothetical protein
MGTFNSAQWLPIDMLHSSFSSPQVNCRNLTVIAEGGTKTPVDVPYVMPGGDQPYKFTFHAKIFHTGKIASVKSASEKDSISVSLSDDNQQAEVR